MKGTVIPYYTEAENFVRPNLTKQFRLRLTPQEYREGMTAARAEGLTLAQFVRLAMRDRKLTVQARLKGGKKDVRKS